MGDGPQWQVKKNGSQIFGDIDVKHRPKVLPGNLLNLQNKFSVLIGLFLFQFKPLTNNID